MHGGGLILGDRRRHGLGANLADHDGALFAELPNGEIAGRLVLSPATARTHVSRIMTKVAARDRAQLVVLAYESGAWSSPAAPLIPTAPGS